MKKIEILVYSHKQKVNREPTSIVVAVQSLPQRFVLSVEDRQLEGLIDGAWEGTQTQLHNMPSSHDTGHSCVFRRETNGLEHAVSNSKATTSHLTANITPNLQHQLASISAACDLGYNGTIHFHSFWSSSQQSSRGNPICGASHPDTHLTSERFTF